MTDPLLTAVVVTYRNTRDIGPCLRALDRALDRWTSEVVVVDNASGDATPDLAQQACPRARVLRSPENLGFGRGCNLGAASATGRYLLFVNPDAVLHEDAVGALLDCAARHRAAGIVGGRAVHPDGTPDPRSWWGRPSLWSAFCFATGLSTAFPGHRQLDPESAARWQGDERAVPVVSGALMLVKRPVWERLRGFDPAYFLYGEDADLCLRAADAGHRAYVAPQALFTHRTGGSSTSSDRQVLLFRGKATLARRRFPRGMRTAGVVLLGFGVGLRAVLARVTRVSAARQGRPTVAPHTWGELWARRREWLGGWRQEAGEQGAGG
ncbi:MAG: glycosyltransferase family 2 protein [Actinomycetes bacterium]